ncbi:MAG TPA: hypothetical protein VFA51_14685 [Candidatus Udaeobacter sp.]|nr:hypothetical protein [Candidatus Udaeobacter sp.]
MSKLRLCNTNDAPTRARARTGRWRERFLRALARSPSVTFACKAAGIRRQTAYAWKERDEAFAAQWDDALNQSLDALEHEAYRFAVSLEGGEPGTASARARMAEFLLKSHRPGIYSDRQRIEHALLGGIVLLPAKEKGKE